ncbi:MAG: hypothetical protein ABF297_03755 [Thiogranum sp.]
MPDGQASRQANRRMDCGTPNCHCFCPVNNLIPEWNSLVVNAHWSRAYRQLDSISDFPEFTGRLCPTPVFYRGSGTLYPKASSPSAD